jgi:hypothetical protein
MIQPILFKSLAVRTDRALADGLIHFLAAGGTIADFRFT